MNKPIEIKINTEFIKLDQLLKFSGIASTGGEAKDLILSEQVYVNNEICTMRGKKIRTGDKVSFKNDNIIII